MGRSSDQNASGKGKRGLGTGHTILQVLDVHNNNLLWERRLHQGLPKLFYTPTAITMLIWDWAGIKEAAKDNADISARLSKLENKDTSYLLEAFRAKDRQAAGLGAGGYREAFVPRELGVHGGQQNVCC